MQILEQKYKTVGNIIVSGDSGWFYNIAHMTNTKHAVDWALAHGANAVEVDLAFTSAGGLDEFFHSKPGESCDCSCLCPAPVWVCAECSLRTCVQSSKKMYPLVPRVMRMNL